MAITRIGAAVGNTQTVTIPAHEAGDLIVIFAYRDGSNTAPSLPAGWTNLTSGGGSTNSMRVGYLIATDSSTVSGTWTSATTCYCVVYRSDGTIGVGSASNTGANSATVSYPARTLTTDPDREGHSWVVGCYGHRNAGTDGTVAPTGMTNVIADDTGITDSGGLHDTNGAVSSWDLQTVGVSASSGWRAATVEVTEIPPAGGGGGGGTVTYTGPDRQALAGTSFTADIGTAAADRIVLVSLAGVPGGGGAPTFVSATINGVAASLIVEGSTDDAHCWFYAEVPTGSGSQTISFTLAQTMFEAVATVYAVYGAETTGITSQFAFDDSFGFQASTAISVTDGGAIFTAASLFTGQSPSFASSTALPNVSASIETDQRGQYALDLDDLTAGTFTTSQDTNFCFAMSSVAFVAAAGGGDPDITGTLSAQETGADSATISGAVSVSGDVAAQDAGADSLAAAGAVAVAGDLAAQDSGADSLAAAGSIAVAGDLAAQDSGTDQAALAGAVAVSGNIGAQEAGDDQASGSGAVAVAGALGAQEAGLDAASISGVLGVGGDVAARIASLQSMMAGQDGALILPYKDFLFQDAGGTVPVTAPGQTVLSIREQGPNARLFQAVGVTYQEDGGLPYLSKTSAGAISAGASTQGATGEMSFFAAMRKTETVASSPTRYTRFFRYVSTDSHGLYYDRNSLRALWKTVRTGGTDVRPEAFSGTSADTVIPVGTDWIFGGQVATTFGDLRINEVFDDLEANSGSALTNQATDTQEFFQQIPGRIYAMLFVDKLLSAAERGTMHGHFYDMMPVDRPDWPTIVAHRGFADNYTQNSMDAFNTAVAGGALWLECDVQASDDGTAWVFHDGTVDALTDGTGNFSDLSDVEISGLRYDFDASDRPIARFTFLLDLLVANPAVQLQAEIKDTGNIGDAFIDTMIALISARGLTSRVVLSSFNLADLTYIRSTHGGAIPLAFVADPATTASVDTCRALGNCDLVGNQNVLGGAGNAIVAYAHDTQGGTVARVNVWAYTVEFESNLRTLADAGVDFSISDRAHFLTVGSLALPLVEWSVGADITGSMDATETGQDQAALTGTIQVAGQLTAQEAGADQAAVSGAVAVAGDLSAQDAGQDGFTGAAAVAVSGSITAQDAGQDQAAGAGSVAVSGDLAAAETGSDTLTASGVVSDETGIGFMAAVEAGQDSATIAGAVAISGALAAVEAGGDIAAAAGAVAVSGSVSAAEAGDDAFSGSGEVEAEPIAGDLAAIETGSDSAAVAGRVAVAGSIGASESGADLIAVLGGVTVIGSAAAIEDGQDTGSVIGFTLLDVIRTVRFLGSWRNRQVDGEWAAIRHQGAWQDRTAAGAWSDRRIRGDWKGRRVTGEWKRK